MLKQTKLKVAFGNGKKKPNEFTDPTKFYSARIHQQLTKIISGKESKSSSATLTSSDPQATHQNKQQQEQQEQQRTEDFENQVICVHKNVLGIKILNLFCMEYFFK